MRKLVVNGSGKRLVLSLLAALSFSAAGVAAQDADPNDEIILDEIVAKVNAEIITLTDLNVELNRLKVQYCQQLSPADCQKAIGPEKKGLLRNMIINKMMIQRAEDMGMVQGVPEQVNFAIQNILKQNPQIQSLDHFKVILEQQGTSYEEYREALGEQYIVQQVQSHFVFSRITIVTTEIEEYYNAHLDEFSDPAEVEIAEILLQTAGKSEADVRPLAEDILARLQAGESFEQLASEYSEGPTANRGGQLPKFKAGTIRKEIENAAATLQPGEFSGLIRMDYGFLIIKLLSRSEATPKPFDDVKDMIASDLRQVKAQPEMKAFLDDLRDQSYVYVAPKYKQMFDLADLF